MFVVLADYQIEKIGGIVFVDFWNWKTEIAEHALEAAVGRNFVVALKIDFCSFDRMVLSLDFCYLSSCAANASVHH